MTPNCLTTTATISAASATATAQSASPRQLTWLRSHMSGEARTAIRHHKQHRRNQRTLCRRYTRNNHRQVRLLRQGYNHPHRAWQAQHDILLSESNDGCSTSTATVQAQAGQPSPRSTTSAMSTTYGMTYITRDSLRTGLSADIDYAITIVDANQLPR
jgi:uncharacterized protein YhjY with autotransporter beta-barrel domain